MYLYIPACRCSTHRIPALEFCSFHSYRVSLPLRSCLPFQVFFIPRYTTYSIADTSLLSVSDTEILRFVWTFASDEEGESDSFGYASNFLASANSNCCYNCATITDDGQLLAVSTSKDNILLYNIDSTEQIFEYVGHNG